MVSTPLLLGRLVLERCSRPCLAPMQDKLCDEVDYMPENDSSHEEDIDEEAEHDARKRQAEAEKEKVSAWGIWTTAHYVRR